MRRIVWLCIVCSLLPTASYAQTMVEGAFGYHVSDYRNREIQPVGWVASAAAKPADWFAIAGEVSGEYTTTRTGLQDVRRRAFVFLSGPRLIAPWRLKTGLFAEAMFGVAHDREFLPERTGTNHFVWQPGGGADIQLFEHLAARFHLAFRLQSFDTLLTTRFVTGFVVRTTRSPEALARAAARRKLEQERRTVELIERAERETRIANANAERDAAEAEALQKEAAVVREKAELAAEQTKLAQQTAAKLKAEAEAAAAKAKGAAGTSKPQPAASGK